jgi:hypothetical protein
VGESYCDIKLGQNPLIRKPFTLHPGEHPKCSEWTAPALRTSRISFAQRPAATLDLAETAMSQSLSRQKSTNTTYTRHLFCHKLGRVTCLCKPFVVCC